MKLQLRKFDITRLRDDSVVIYIGARNTGKTVNLMDTLRYHTNIPVGVVISPTESANHNYEKYIPKMLIYDEYEPGIIQRFLDRQKKIMDQYNAEIKKYGRTDLDPRAFLILDDCLYDKSWINDKNIRYIFMNGRHLKIFFLITMQYPLGIPPALRGNADYIFINRCNMIKDRERIYQQYAGMFPNFDVFGQVMNQTTTNYECLVIDKRNVKTNNIEDQVFWYKADPVANFRLCSKELWDIQSLQDERRALGMADEPDDEEDFDPNVIVKKKNQPRIRVHKSYE